MVVEQMKVKLATVVRVSDGADVAEQFDSMAGANFFAHLARCGILGTFVGFDFSGRQAPLTATKARIGCAFEHQQAVAGVKHQVQRIACGGGRLAGHTG